MKKMTLFFAALFLVGITAHANDQKHADRMEGVNIPTQKFIKRYGHQKPIVFVEGGVKFFVFKNGEIDFRSVRRTRSRSRNVNWYQGNYYSPGRGNRNWNSNGFSVRYDRYGRINQVGMNSIRYNRYDQVRRIGAVLINYNRRGLVSQIGGLQIYYGKHGRIRHIEGDIHYTGCGFCGINSCSAPHVQDYGLPGYFNDNHYYHRRGKGKNKHHYKKHNHKKDHHKKHDHKKYD